MIGMRKVQYRITQKDHQLLVLAVEFARQRLVPRLNHHSVADPLPKLRLRGPKLPPVAADDQRALPLFLFLLVLAFFSAHILLNTHLALRGVSAPGEKKLGWKEATHSTPRGS